MAEVKVNQPESLLNREQLREVERFQAKFAELERQLSHCVDEFLSVLNRHYFNRENGFLDEQQENLREIVTIQSKLESLASGMGSSASELKTRMLELQRDIQGGQPRQRQSKPAEQTQAKPEPTKEQPKPQPAPAAASGPVSASALIDRQGSALGDSSEAGGEISLRLVFEGLKLTDPANAGALGEISTALRKLLYDRKLVGYSKSSLVFGKNRTVAEVLDDLSPIFLAPSILGLMTTMRLIEPGEGTRFVLACNQQRELIYILGK